jgi:transposase
MKRSMGCDHFLVRGLRKVTGEFSLMCLGYNLIRARTLLGFDGLLGLMRAPLAPAAIP